MHLVRRIAPGVLAGSLVLGGVSGAFAAKAHRAQYAFAYGQVSNLATSGFTLTWTPRKAAQGTTPTQQTAQVTTSTTTKVRALQGTSVAIANGDYALVIGVPTSTGIQANRVVYSTTPFRPGKVLRRGARTRAKHRVVGTVNGARTTPTTLVITTRKGVSLTFAITSATKFRVNRQIAATAPSLTDGQRVAVWFKGRVNAKTAKSTPLTALIVGVLPAAPAKS